MTGVKDGPNLAAMFEAMDQAYCLCEMMLDADGTPVDYRYIEVNSLFSRMTGIHEVVGRTAREVNPDMEPDWIGRVAQAGLERRTVTVRQATKWLGRCLVGVVTPVEPHGRFVAAFRDVTLEIPAMAESEAERARITELLDSLPLVVWTQSVDGSPDINNRTLREYFGIEGGEMGGDKWITRMHPDDRDIYVEAYRNARTHGLDFHGEIRALDARGDWRDLEVWAKPRFDQHGTYLGIIGASADVTDRVRAERGLHEKQDLLDTLIESSPTGIFIADKNGYMLRTNAEYRRIVGRSEEHIRSLPDGRSLYVPGSGPTIEAVVAEVQRTGKSGPYGRVALRPDGTTVPVVIEMVRRPAHDDFFAFVTDQTERQSRERHRDLLLREVNHRSKNLLAVIQSLARQTVRDVAPEDFVATFSGRLSGLAGLQDLLIAGDWETVAMEDLVRSQLHFVCDSGATRIALDGERVSVGPAAAQGIGMALHELATNAMKYGALSTDGGCVRIEWGLRGSDGDARFWMSWTEADGPPVTPPERRGFGYNVISRALEHSLEAQVALCFPVSGLTWHIEAPVGNILHRDERGPLQ